MARWTIRSGATSVAAGPGRSSSASPTPSPAARVRSSATSSPLVSSDCRESRAPMDFTLSDEQVLLRDTAQALLTRHCPTSLVRAHIDDPSAADPLWDHL